MRTAREEAERRAREEAERRAREEARRKAREEAESEREAKEKAKQETLGKILGKIVLAFFSFAAIGIGVKSCVDSATQSSFVSAVRRNHEQGKVQLWEGGPYWATKNIGAEKPEDSGLYFWWGNTVGYRREGDAWVASDGSSRNFKFDDVPTFGKDNATLRREGWTTAAGILAPAYDAAHVHWGGDWRMPTKQELDDLGSKCDWTWTTRNGVSGYLVRGQGAYVDASIFLPAAGYGYGASLGFAGSCGCYWSSVPDEGGSSNAWGLGFSSGDHDADYDYRDNGRSVRPVQGFAK